MDPNLFHLDWARTTEVLAALVVFSFIIERALSILFESRLWEKGFKLKHKGFKEWIALIVAWGACWFWDFDAISMIFLKSEISPFGTLLTAAVIAGGSKGSLALFQNVLKVGRTLPVKEASDEKPKS